MSKITSFGNHQQIRPNAGAFAYLFYILAHFLNTRRFKMGSYSLYLRDMILCTTPSERGTIIVRNNGTTKTSNYFLSRILQTFQHRTLIYLIYRAHQILSNTFYRILNSHTNTHPPPMWHLVTLRLVYFLNSPIVKKLTNIYKVSFDEAKRSKFR